MFYDIPNALLIIAAVMNLFLGLLIFIKQRHVFENVIYLFHIFAIILWIVSMILYRTHESELTVFIFAHALYIFPTVIASTFLFFCLYFPRQEKTKLWFHSTLVFIPNIFLILFILYPGAILKDIEQLVGLENRIVFGDYYLVYFTYIFSYFTTALIILAIRYYNTKKEVTKRQLLFLLIGGGISANLAMITNLILPWFGNYTLNWLGNVLTIILVSSVVYAIFKHRLFDTKVVLTEILILSLSIFMLIMTVLPQSTGERMLNFFLFLCVLIIGLLLIKSVNKEIRTREHIQQLAQKLEKSNQRLKALDKQKSEFVSIASHQLRSPLTAIRGYASMLTEGSFGKFPKKAKEPLDRIAESARIMALSIEDYLSVSRIESGNMKYENSVFNLPDKVEKTVDDLQEEAVKKGLLLMYKNKTSTKGKVYADEGKIQQILHNLINNALKYTEKGSIDVVVDDSKKDKEITVSVIDTGIGMSEETLATIFQKFQRSRNANSVNVHGTGLGLYVALKMANDMGGDIIADSKGDGKGSTFTFSLPTTNKEKSSNAK